MHIYILALEMASPGNQHCANCIGTLLFDNLLSARVVMRETLLSVMMMMLMVVVVMEGDADDGGDDGDDADGGGGDGGRC